MIFWNIFIITLFLRYKSDNTCWVISIIRWRLASNLLTSLKWNDFYTHFTFQFSTYHDLWSLSYQFKFYCHFTHWKKWSVSQSPLARREFDTLIVPHSLLAVIPDYIKIKFQFYHNWVIMIISLFALYFFLKTGWRF